MGMDRKKTKIEGEVSNLWVMTKKGSSEILADENRIFRDKGQIGKIFDGVREIFGK